MKHSTSAFLTSRSRIQVPPAIRTLHLPPAAFAAKKQLSQKPKGLSDGVGGLRAEPGEAENGQNVLVALPRGFWYPWWRGITPWMDECAGWIDGGRR